MNKFNEITRHFNIAQQFAIEEFERLVTAIVEGDKDFGNPVFLQEQLDNLQEAIDAYRITCNQELLNLALDRFSRNIYELSGLLGQNLTQLLFLSASFRPGFEKPSDAPYYSSTSQRSKFRPAFWEKPK